MKLLELESHLVADSCVTGKPVQTKDCLTGTGYPPVFSCSLSVSPLWICTGFRTTAGQAGSSFLDLIGHVNEALI